MYQNANGKLLTTSKKGILEYDGAQLVTKFPVSSICILQDSINKNYLVGTSDNGIYVLDKNFNIIDQYINQKGGIIYIRSIQTLDKNKYLISTNVGVVLFELKNNKLNYVKLLARGQAFLGCKDQYGTFWYATENSITSINSRFQVKKFSTSDGLSSTLIYTINAYKQFVYVGTNNGINKIEITKNGGINKIETLNIFNGFDGIETNFNSGHVDKFGNIYFGTVKGLYKYLTYGFPKIHNKKNNIKIASLSVFNEEFGSSNLWFNVPEQNHRFQYNQNFLTFKLGQSTSEINKKTFYSYKLENYNKNWSKPETSNEISYSNLSPGHYILKIREVDLFSNQLGAVITYSFFINEPFYATWWFFSLIAIVFGGILNFAFQKSLRFNKEYVKTLSENTFVEYKKKYLLYFGLIVIITSVFYVFLKIITEAELITRIFFAASCLLFYFLSNYTIILKNLKYIFISYFVLDFIPVNLC